jgi:organic radical activating enzyme
MIKIPSLSYEIIKSCNLKCQGCSHFTDINNLKNKISIYQIKEELSNWNEIIEPEIFKVLGGEPLIHNELIPVLELIKKLYGKSDIIIYSNGLLLKNFDDHFGRTIADLKVKIRISVHSNNKEFLSRLEEPIERLKSWKDKYGLNYALEDAIQGWQRSYRYLDNKIYPYNDKNPKLSWKVCHARWCKQLYKNKIYKCHMTAYLQDVVDKLDDSYKIYMNYEPLKHNADIEQIKEFFNTKHEFVCGACPINPEFFIKEIL